MVRRLVIALAALLVLAAPASAASLTPRDRVTLQRYAADTWRSFDLLVNARSGLPADKVGAAGARSAYTSPTNIGAYLWATVGAHELGLIGRREADARAARTLDTLGHMERHAASGQFYNWYDPATGARLTTWPPDGTPLTPFLSSVDNAWLATALWIVARGLPDVGARARAIAASMDFGFFYDPAVGQLRGGAWTQEPTGCSAPASGVWFTCNHYDVLNSEPRIADYLAIASGGAPPASYFHLNRTFPPSCDFSWTETQAGGVTRRYLGVDVFEGHYDYRGMHVVPTWGGSMFEALMPALFVPEAQWGPRSWAINHPLYVRAQIEHGLVEAGYGVWGFSPSDNPSGGYSAYGVDAIGMQADGYPSNNDTTLVDHGYGECRPALPDPPPSAYTNGVVTPHASFLALDYAPHAAVENLDRLRARFAVYGPGGFYDAVNVSTGQVARAYLAVDQGMAMAGAVNALTGDRLQQLFAPTIERQVRPLLAMEHFTAG